MIGRKTTLGIVLTAAGGQAALVRRRRVRRAPKVLAATKSQTAIDTFDPIDPARLVAVFKELAKALPSMARRADLPIYVSVPDPLVREDIMQFKVFPDAPQEAQDLIRLRLQREAAGAARDPVCSYQVISTQDDNVTVRVRSIERGLRDAVEDAANAAGLHVSRLESWTGYACAGLAGVTDDGVYMWSDGESWSLTCWADSAPEGYFESGWVDGTDDRLGPRLGRLVQSFAMAHGLGPVTLIADAPDSLIGAVPAGIVGNTKAGADAMPTAGSPAEQVAVWG